MLGAEVGWKGQRVWGVITGMYWGLGGDENDLKLIIVMDAL